MKSKMSAHEFEIMYDKYKNLLYRIAFTYLKGNQDIEDVLQEVFIKRMYHAPKFQSEEHEKRWLIRITVNHCKNQVSSFWKKNVFTSENTTELLETDQYGFNTEESELFSAVKSLHEKYRITIYLYYYEGYKCREIAEILKCKDSTVKMRLKKGRELLKSDLGEENIYEIREI